MTSSVVAVPPFPRGGLREAVFTEAVFFDLLHPHLTDEDGSRTPLVEWTPSLQLRYIAEYLHKLTCTRIVIESLYTDRDFRDDYGTFYARTFRAYPSHCTRLHFFSATGANTVASMLNDEYARISVAESENDRDLLYQAAGQHLSSQYLGFIIVRPLARRPIGRSVLRPIETQDTKQNLRLSRHYDVHLGGFSLTITGLAFQQQDQGTSACATTAIWTALQTAERTQPTTLTPAEITRLATIYAVPEGRAFPSGGLTPGQMCEAIRGAQLSPYFYRHDSFDVMLQAVALAVQSGMPAIALLHLEADPKSKHAVTVVGGDIDFSTPAQTLSSSRSRAAYLHAVLLHDDRFGPYVPASIEKAPTSVDREGVFARLFRDKRTDNAERSSVILTIPGFESTRRYVLAALLFPVQPTTRLAFGTLVGLGERFADRAAQILEKAPITFDAVVLPSTEYTRAILTSGTLAPKKVAILCQELPLPRYVAIIHLYLIDLPIIDILIDTTEPGSHPPVIAVVVLVDEEAARAAGRWLHSICDGAKLVMPNEDT